MEMLSFIPGIAPQENWKDIPITENGELLVPLGPFSDYRRIHTNSIYGGEYLNSPYFENSLPGSFVTIFVRKQVAEMLISAQSYLPEGAHLILFDTQRKVETQQGLFDNFYGKLIRLHPSWTEESLMSETEKMVSIPSSDPTKPSPHSTGGAVDLAFIRLPQNIDQELKRIDQELDGLSDNDWRTAYFLETRRIALINNYAVWPNFGTPFDYGDKEANLRYYEKLLEEDPSRELSPLEKEAQKNRRILFWAMIRAGFMPYIEEWWHYNSPKSQMGAKVAGLPFAEYGAATLSVENLAHEQMRKEHMKGSRRIFEGAQLSKKVDPLWEHFIVVQQSLNQNGDPRLTSLPKAAVIAPAG